MAVDKKYMEEAKQMLSGGMEANKVQLNNSFNQNVQGLEGQKAGVNQNFGNQLEQNAINTTGNKNQYLNNSLARGLGRSTIATSGAAGIQDSGNRRANYIEQDKTNALGNIEAQKAILQQSLQESLLGLTTQFESQSLTMAGQLENQAYSRQAELDRFNYSKEQDAADRAFAQSKFDYQKQQDALAYQLALKARSSGGSRYSSGSDALSSNDKTVPLDNTVWSAFSKQLDNFMRSTGTQGSPNQWLESSGIKSKDPQAYAQMKQIVGQALSARKAAGGRTIK